jgi:hypothetical protein
MGISLALLDLLIQANHLLGNKMMMTLLMEPGQLVHVKSTSLPLGSFVKLQPQSVDFLDITDPKAVRFIYTFSVGS